MAKNEKKHHHHHEQAADQKLHHFEHVGHGCHLRRYFTPVFKRYFAL
ncbi:hypothetical protein [Salinicoccus roseus]|nr:hypothetical protein [Salinicoccus roseus]